MISLSMAFVGWPVLQMFCERLHLSCKCSMIINNSISLDWRLNKKWPSFIQWIFFLWMYPNVYDTSILISSILLAITACKWSTHVMLAELGTFIVHLNKYSGGSICGFGHFLLHDGLKFYCNWQILVTNMYVLPLPIHWCISSQFP